MPKFDELYNETRMEIFHRYPLKSFNTFGLEVYAREFAVLENEEDIAVLVDRHRVAGYRMLLLGGGSNILFSGDYDGFVVKIGLKGKEVIDEDEESVVIRGAAGEDWDDFVGYAVQMGWGGLENLSGIPGTVGSSPIQNIGAYGCEMKDRFESLGAVDLCTGEYSEFDPARCRFGYRDSIFKTALKGRMLITHVDFRLDKKLVPNLSYEALKSKLGHIPPEDLTPQHFRNEVLQIRNSKLPDPHLLGNAGSFFKNPFISVSEFEKLKDLFSGIVSYPVEDKESHRITGYKLAAGWLIEKCGWKGYRDGDAGVHKDQALVLVNYGRATGIDILTLSEKIRNSVMEKFGVSLEREVNII